MISPDRTAAILVALSRWVDESPANAGRDAEARTWGRVAKVAEECGEAVAAMIGLTGQNPRKGVVGGSPDLVEELLDVAVTALAAVEHVVGHTGISLALLELKVEKIARRAELEVAP